MAKRYKEELQYNVTHTGSGTQLKAAFFEENRPYKQGKENNKPGTDGKAVFYVVLV